MPHRLRLRGSDRALMVCMTWLWPGLLGLSRVVQPDTILRWHRAGFRAYWRWKSRARSGRPPLDRELRELIRRMSKENPLWGAPRIHGELLKLGFEVAESTVSKYMIERRGPPSQTWRTFLLNHADAIAAIDLCVVPTLTFECLFAFLVLGHGTSSSMILFCRAIRSSAIAMCRSGLGKVVLLIGVVHGGKCLSARGTAPPTRPIALSSSPRRPSGKQGRGSPGPPRSPRQP
jgi:hypothetical protein